MTWFANPPRLAPSKPKQSPFAPPNPFTGKPTADTMLAPPGWFDDDWEVEQKPKPVPPSHSDILEDDRPVQVGRKSRTLEWNIAIVSLIAYIGAAVWMRAGLGYAIGDALARSANARAMVESRYPGIAPVGFVWMPLPTLIQVPFMMVLEPIGLASYAGPVANSFCGALAAYILVRTCRDWGLSDKLTTVLVLLYALNPVVIFHQANGMSEGVFLPCLAILLNGFLSWTYKANNKALLTMAVGLALATIVRYEMTIFAPIIALGVALQRRDRSREHLLRGIRSAFVVALPSLYAFLLWLATSRLIVGDAFFWKKVLTQQSGGAGPPDAVWLPQDRSTLSLFLHVCRWSVVLAPGLIILVPLLLARRKKIVVGSNWISVFSAVFPGIVFYLFTKNQTAAAARYFAPVLIFPICMSIALLARRKGDARPFGRFWWVAQCIVLMTALTGTVTGSLTFTDARRTAIEGEYQVFRPGLGRPPSDVETASLIVPPWRSTTEAIDKALAERPKSKIGIDMGSTFPTFLFSKYPDRFVIDADRDYEQTVSAGNNLEGVDFVFVLKGKTSAMSEAVTRMATEIWESVEISQGTLYKRRVATTPNRRPMALPAKAVPMPRSKPHVLLVET